MDKAIEKAFMINDKIIIMQTDAHNEHVSNWHHGSDLMFTLKITVKDCNVIARCCA
jgi:hypothetical protein